MLHNGVPFVIATQADSQPPFWWIGLFASPGGLRIVGVVILIITLLVIVPIVRRRRG
jgi:hypothetical protein